MITFLCLIAACYIVAFALKVVCNIIGFVFTLSIGMLFVPILFIVLFAVGLPILAYIGLIAWGVTGLVKAFA